ncbi:MAG TPA: hypothetical protein VIS73_01410 [Rhodocyclaceae bacterium]
MDECRQRDQREQVDPIPPDLYQRLTASQIFAIRRIESFGYELRFVRRQGLPEAIPFVASPSVSTFGVVEPDGNINHKHTHVIRPSGG